MLTRNPAHLRLQTRKELQIAAGVVKKPIRVRIVLHKTQLRKEPFPVYAEPAMASDQEMDEILYLSTTRSKAKPNMRVDAATLRNSKVMHTLPEFISQLARANLELETELANKDRANKFELDEKSAALQPHIEMDLYTGVVEKQTDQSRPGGSDITIPTTATAPSLSQAEGASSSPEAESASPSPVSSPSSSSSSSSQKPRVVIKKRKRSSAVASPHTSLSSLLPDLETQMRAPPVSSPADGNESPFSSSSSSSESASTGGGSSSASASGPARRIVKIRCPKPPTTSSSSSSESQSPSPSESESESSSSASTASKKKVRVKLDRKKRGRDTTEETASRSTKKVKTELMEEI